MDKIYSRKRIRFPKINKKEKKKYEKLKIANRFKIIIIFVIAAFVAISIIGSIEPIIDKESIEIAQNVAGKIANEQSRYSYGKI